jgi:hypothetical protein
MIIARETLNRLYGAGNQLSMLPVEPEATGRLQQLLDEASALSAQASVAELADAFGVLAASPGGVEEARRCAEAAEQELRAVWSGAAQAAAAAAVRATLDRLDRVRVAAEAAEGVRERLLARVAEVGGVIQDGRRQLTQARELVPRVVAAGGSYGDRVQFEEVFQRVRDGGVTGAALVYQAYLRFDVVCAEAREALLAISLSAAGPAESQPA